MALHLYQNDLPDDLDLGPIVAVDCETMGLNPARDRLCLVQLSSGDSNQRRALSCSFCGSVVVPVSSSRKVPTRWTRVCVPTLRSPHRLPP